MSSRKWRSVDGEKWVFYLLELYWILRRNTSDFTGKNIAFLSKWYGKGKTNDRLFIKENPDEAKEGKDFKSNLNPDSLKITECYVEPHVRSSKAGDKFQFERIGYFCMDKETTNDKLVFNRTVTLKDSWTKTKS